MEDCLELSGLGAPLPDGGMVRFVCRVAAAPYPAYGTVWNCLNGGKSETATQVAVFRVFSLSRERGRGEGNRPH